MNTRKRHLIPVTALLILAGFCIFKFSKSPVPGDRHSGEKRGKVSQSEFSVSDAHLVSPDIKSRSRLRPAVPTLEETGALLNTVLPVVDLPPDRSVKETAEAINKLLREAGIGILMLAALGFIGLTDIHQMNALKNILGSLINVVASIMFVCRGMVDWPKAGVMTIGAVAGNYLGSHYSQKIPQIWVRRIVLAIGFGISAVTFYQQMA